MISHVLTLIVGVIIGNALKQFIYIGFKKPEVPQAVQVNPEEIAQFLDPEVRDWYDNYFSKLEV